MRILIAYAVEPEFAPWRKLQRFESVETGSFTIQRTKVGSAEADFLVTGMGPQHARRAMEALQPFSYDACICAGFAGALDSQLFVGDIFVPERVREAETGQELTCDPLLTAAARSAGPGQTLLSSAIIIASAEEKAELSRVAAAVDMESFVVMSAALKRGVPAAAVRTISDTSDQEMPLDFSKSLDEKGQVSTGSVLRSLAGQPGKVAALMRLGRQSKRAAESLAQFLLVYIPRLAELHSRDSAAVTHGS